MADESMRYIKRPKLIKFDGANEPIVFSKFFVDNILVEIPLDDPGPSLAENIQVIQERVFSESDWIPLDEPQYALVMRAVRSLQMSARGQGPLWLMVLPFILAIVGATKTKPEEKEAA
jgi:hypothetical protein